MLSVSGERRVKTPLVRNLTRQLPPSSSMSWNCPVYSNLGKPLTPPVIAVGKLVDSMSNHLLHAVVADDHDALTARAAISILVAMAGSPRMAASASTLSLIHI